MKLLKKAFYTIAEAVLYTSYYKLNVFSILLPNSSIDKTQPFTKPKTLDFDKNYYQSMIYAASFLLLSKKRKTNLSFKKLLTSCGIEKAYQEYSISDISINHTKNIENWKIIERYNKYFSPENELAEFSKFISDNKNIKEFCIFSIETNLNEKDKFYFSLYSQYVNKRVRDLSKKFNVNIRHLSISNLPSSEQKIEERCNYLLTKGAIQENTIFYKFILSSLRFKESLPCLSLIIPLYIGRNVNPSINLIRDKHDINLLIFFPFIYYILKKQEANVDDKTITNKNIIDFLSNKDKNTNIFYNFLDQCFPENITNSKAIKLLYSSCYSSFNIQEGTDAIILPELVMTMNSNKIPISSVQSYLTHFFEFIFEQKTNEFLLFKNLSTNSNKNFINDFENLMEYNSQLQLTGLIDPNNYNFESVNFLQLPLKIAIHFHIYYLDLLNIVVETLSKLPFNFDLFLTTSHSSLLNFKGFFDFKFKNKGKVTIIVTPNFGRDVAPWLIEIAKVQDNYDIVGHFHTKKSVIDSQRGSRWFNSILSSLLSPKNSQYILISFYLNKELGCVVPQPYKEILEVWNEHGVPVIGENLNNIKALLKRMNILKPFDRSDLFFSVGTMLWYRPSALRPLFNLKLKYHDFGEEPLPLDGSLAHAIERLPKIVCVNEGFKIICLEEE